MRKKVVKKFSHSKGFYYLCKLEYYKVIQKKQYN